jgi:hypothetical protein
MRLQNKIEYFPLRNGYLHKIPNVRAGLKPSAKLCGALRAKRIN